MRTDSAHLQVICCYRYVGGQEEHWGHRPVYVCSEIVGLVRLMIQAVAVLVLISQGELLASLLMCKSSVCMCVCFSLASQTCVCT